MPTNPTHKDDVSLIDALRHDADLYRRIGEDARADRFEATADRFAELVSAQPAGPITRLPTHQYVADPDYPWFCKLCGYPPHEPLKHPQGNDVEDLSHEG